MNDIKDSSIEHNDDELDFHEFEAFDDPSHQTTSGDEASNMFGQRESSFSHKARAFENLRFDADRGRSVKIIVIVVVILGVLGFIIYHLAAKGVFSNWGKKNASSQVATITAPQPTVNSMVQQQEAKTAELTTKMSTIDQTLTQQQQTIDQIQTNMNTLQDSVAGLNTTVGTVSQQLTQLNDKLGKATAPKKTIESGPPAPPPITYVIKALVPGRAWLLASDGTMLSVAAGNAVPGHGVVNQIDLNTGQLFMSDGSVFTYDINGN